MTQFRFSLQQRSDLKAILTDRRDRKTVELIINRLEQGTGSILAGAPSTPNTVTMPKRGRGRPRATHRDAIVVAVITILVSSGMDVAKAGTGKKKSSGTLMQVIKIVLDAAGLDVPGEDSLWDVIAEWVDFVQLQFVQGYMERYADRQVGYPNLRPLAETTHAKHAARRSRRRGTRQLAEKANAKAVRRK